MREAEFYRRVVDDGPAATLVVTRDGVVSYANRRAVTVLGADVTGAAFAGMFAADDARSAGAFVAEVITTPADALVFFEGEASLLSAGRRLYLHVVGANMLTAPEVGAVVLTITDATELKSREEALAARALTDALTGLPNRALLLDRLAELRRSGAGGALAFLDLDGFKRINDMHGHNVGDQLLIVYASRLLETCPQDATVARLGGDEFVLLLPRVSVEQAAELARAACAAIEAPAELATGTVQGSVSAGVTTVEGPSADGVLREADAAMYAAKTAGGGAVVVAGPDLATWADSRRDLAARITALEAERRRLRDEVRTDPLTRLANRRALDDALAQMGPGGAVSDTDLSVLFVDIDRFGSYNHLHGDAAGDRMLQRVAGILRDTCRSHDTAFRKGGEEFVVVLPGTGLAEAVAAAERIRTAVELARLPHGGQGTPTVTVTVGVAQRHPGETSGDAIDRAGSAAYHGKMSGRRNEVHSDSTTTRPVITS